MGGASESGEWGGGEGDESGEAEDSATMRAFVNKSGRDGGRSRIASFF